MIWAILSIGMLVWTFYDAEALEENQRKKDDFEI